MEAGFELTSLGVFLYGARRCGKLGFEPHEPRLRQKDEFKFEVEGLSTIDFRGRYTEGAKHSRIYGLAKLADANEVGGKNSEKCTLVLTEGDSAKALVIVGLAVVGRDHYGVFPLRGKLLNDHDGSHIKGLLINFIHSFWPSLLKVPTFLLEFITPIVKRLGTSTDQEGKEYFSDLAKHMKDFVWVDGEDDDAIKLAFSKKKIEARKNWLRQFEQILSTAFCVH
ncbi:hypothetical protein ACS0TY_010975 [Phlomoides rotata]